MRRGDVVRLRLPKGVGHEQRGSRYGVILQANAFLPNSVVVIAPTSISARAASFRPEITIGKQHTKVLVEQIGAVDTNRLSSTATHLSAEETWSIEDALRAVLDLW